MPKAKTKATQRKPAKKNPVSKGKKRTGSDGSRVKDVFGIVLITLAAMITIALLSYNANDFPKGSRTGSEVQNLLGPFGANIAFYLSEFTFGRFLSLILPLFLFYGGLDLLRGKGQRILKRQLLPILTASILAVAIWSWVRLVQGMPDSSELTGLIGIGLQSLLVNFLGITGAALLLAALTLIHITLVLRISWGDILHVTGAGLAALAGMIKLPERKPKPKIRPKPEPKVAPGKKTTPTPPVSDNLDLDLDDEDEADWDEFKSGMPEIVRTPPESNKNTGPKDVNGDPKARPEDYVLPSSELLVASEDKGEVEWDENELRSRAKELEERLSDYGVAATVVAIHPGPVITRYDLRPSKGVKVSRISSLSDDLAMSLSAVAIRIIAPIPGAGAVGIEVPNETADVVYLRDIIESAEWASTRRPLSIALGKTAQGDELIVDLGKMPHLMIAGTTGSGKSVCINTVIASVLMRNRPDEVQLVMIDPKKIELSAYSELRRHHLLFLESLNEVIATEPKNAVALLQSVVLEMERRYDLLAETGARNLKEFNKIVQDRLKEAKDNGKGEDDKSNGDNEPLKPLPHIVVIIDELADLMIVAAREVEEPIARLAQMARAVGIHLIVATQRPSVDVITGVIKANFPARIAFMVASKIDSRTILDRAGAEKLLGSGDGLFLSNASPTPIRFHGAFISTDEVHKLIAHVRKQPAFVKQVELKSPEEESGGSGGGGDLAGDRDPLFPEGVKVVARHQQGSVSLLQRRLKIGYSRAGRLLDQLEMAGVVGPFEGSKAREVYISEDQVDSFLINLDGESE
ncbi:DNA translocase FtsK 4TM domain-containing protein [bacterium]|nr:DNA translocase FtsK 4TM domain-containing protein [bacterium]